MSLKLRLKPHEKLIISGAVIVNGSKSAEFLVENNVPILRESDIMGEAQVTSPSRRLYFCVQLMYIDNGNTVPYLDQYQELANAIVTAAPSTGLFIAQISEKVVAADFYHALKLARKLIDYEEQLLETAIAQDTCTSSIP
jgi:flagellar protein FlbT